ncbi:hypothetical protein D1B31_21540 [Neobacillus notoginsengisoli]|uniref:20S proteasome subunit A/B n=1 Tax=Neobacillus notoginsengisoli TaxID=1578198 RepID=A0A417YH38_9BACI|nr:hypothetical protein [Neobacillus notoginsengisoli]RHW32126.1 hypothetical protein D1B31_21540 [Neobacillus notoginsengisoli]
MSLIICTYVPTGIVLSGDSRTTVTLQNTQQVPNRVTHTTNLVLSDATNKIFRVFNKFGVGTFGGALINDLPIEHYIKEFEHANQENALGTTGQFATQLLAYFRAFSPIPTVSFLVAGYDHNEPFVFQVNVPNNQCERINTDPASNEVQYGIIRGGDTEIVNRLLSQPQHLPLFGMLNLQDAIDFSRHLIRATIDQLRFEPRFPTVGGPIDTLILKPNETTFIVKKQLTTHN